jgi:ribosome-associated protein
MSRVTPAALERARELRVEFYRASGPGGQNVNKVSTAVRLRFDVADSKVLPEEVKRRLARQAASKMTAGGVLVIEARSHRTQDRNRKEAIRRLMVLIQRAQQKPRLRRPTKPTARSKERRLETKKRRSARKISRGSTGDLET